MLCVKVAGGNVPLSSDPTRAQLGQWFTPEPLADLVLSLALQGAPPGARLLDPSCGDGVFLRRAIERGVPAHTIVGVDIDERALVAARMRLSPEVALLHGDFFDAATMSGQAFDVVVGNPPYVRQERIRAAAKVRVVEAVLHAWPTLARKDVEGLVGRSDLAAPFVLCLLRTLKPSGVATLVLSSAFFDSGYGAAFWHLAEKVASLRQVVHAPKERWFCEAAVNTVVAVFDAAPSNRPVRMMRLNSSTSEVLKQIGAGADFEAVSGMRMASRERPAEWGCRLRAPDAWLRFALEARDLLVPLGDLAQLRRGITSGANDIFYLSEETSQAFSIEDRFLRPLVTARGRTGRGAILVRAQELSLSVLTVEADIELTRHPGLARYLESFSDVESRRTLAARVPWWSLRSQEAQVFLCKAYGERFVQPYCETPILADQRMYTLEPKEGVSPDLLSALLNATSTALAIESSGRTSMGQGALELSVRDAQQLPVIDIRRLKDSSAVRSAFSALCVRPVAKVSQEAAMADRRTLDESLLTQWPELAAQLPALRHALVETCIARQGRAKAGVGT